MFSFKISIKVKKLVKTRNQRWLWLKLQHFVHIIHRFKKKKNQNTRYFLHIINERDAYRGDQSNEAEKKEWSVKPVTESSSDCSSSPEESSERKIV